MGYLPGLGLELTQEVFRSCSAPVPSFPITENILDAVNS